MLPDGESCASVSMWYWSVTGE